jgi:hypothetical protein
VAVRQNDFVRILKGPPLCFFLFYQTQPVLLPANGGQGNGAGVAGKPAAINIFLIFFVLFIIICFLLSFPFAFAFLFFSLL